VLCVGMQCCVLCAVCCVSECTSVGSVHCVWCGGWVDSESGDHGPFNSWDRQVYVTEVRTGQPDVIKEWDDISHNFMIANYNSQEAIDNDDGSWCVVWVRIAPAVLVWRQATSLLTFPASGCVCGACPPAATTTPTTTYCPTLGTA
jgi:hypothetical protein